MIRCAILGASGHGKVVAEIAELNGYTQVDFFDDRWPELKNQEHWNVLGSTQDLINEVSNYDLVVVAIGDNATRLNKQRILEMSGGIFKVLIHPSVTISKYSQVGNGTVIMANAVVNSFASIGNSCIINTSSIVEHDCVLSDGVHISPGANLAGSVHIGERTWVGIGSQIKQLVSIGSDVVIGAGSTVIKNVVDDQVIVGNPAKCIK
ncbi:acetyltransferase [Aliivibrio fischeri]|uniref:acetyltransferase n=1 Tax=Aliivibrio fischeri TaxID=668 RepID=UPI0012DA6BE1|nr:acetyltransferase [Aliivibrio fischeri]MUK39971.1 acetyltransferase [Aliivibrio fischeri]